MQRGTYLQLAALMGALALAGRMISAASADTLDPSKSLPSGWSEVNLSGGSGNLTLSGPAADPKTVWTMNVNGDDIQGTNDRGYFVYTTLKGDGGITARILSQTGGRADGWTKTGVMLRADSSEGSVMATINQAALQNGTETLFRTDQDANAGANEAGVFGHAPPQWLRAQRHGQQYQLLLSDDGKQWRIIKEMTLAIDPSMPILAGLDGSTAAGGNFLPGTATFDNVSVTSDVIVPPAGLSLEATPGSGQVLLTYGTTLNAAGYNIYRRLASDTPDKAVLLNAQPTLNGWFIDDNGGKGLTNGTHYVYQVKAVIKDASGSATEGASSSEVLAEPQVPILGGLYSYDIGTLTPGSTTLDNSGTLTITGSGNQIAALADQFRFVATPMSGAFSITAKILGKPMPGSGNTQTAIKAGVMVRESLDPGARMADMLLTSGSGILMEDRRGYRMNYEEVGLANSDVASAFGSANPVVDGDVKVPLWLRLTRSGDTIEGGYSTDGTTFTNVDPPNGPIPNLSPITDAGLCVTASQDGTLATAKFDATSIKIQ
jgi:hypothetical protein